LQEKKRGASSRLGVVEIACVAWHAAFQPLQQEKTCNPAHEQTPLSNDIIDSVLWHGEVVRAKDLSAPPHTVLFYFCKIFSIQIFCGLYYISRNVQTSIHIVSRRLSASRYKFSQSYARWFITPPYNRKQQTFFRRPSSNTTFYKSLVTKIFTSFFQVCLSHTIPRLDLRVAIVARSAQIPTSVIYLFLVVGN
jgi:hypothetical protein